MTYSTLKPVPSFDPRDLDDNAQAFDRFLNANTSAEPDRFGVMRKTWHQMELDAAALVAPNVSALAAVTPTVDKAVFFNAVTPVGMGSYTLTAFTRTLSGNADAAAWRTGLELGTAAVLAAGAANGVATLGADGKLPVSQLPPLAINETFTVASQAAMLALTAQRGDVAIRSDLNGAAYLLTTDVPSMLGNWVPIQQNLGVALGALAALTPAADKIAYFNGTATAALADFTSVARTLLAATTQAAQRTALGVAGLADKPAWTSYTPTITNLGGTYTSASATGRYLVNGGICYIQIALTVTTKGTGSFPTLSLPATVPALNGMANHMLPCRESQVNLRLGQAKINVALTGVQISAYDSNELVTADGCIVLVNGFYPIA